MTNLRRGIVHTVCRLEIASCDGEIFCLLEQRIIIVFGFHRLKHRLFDTRRCFQDVKCH